MGLSVKDGGGVGGSFLRSGKHGTEMEAMETVWVIVLTWRSVIG